MIRALRVLLLCAAASAAAAAGETGLKKASYLPQWSPQSQFAGFYVAYEKGLYRGAGLDASILRGGPEEPPGAYLESKKADFATLWLCEALKLRARGVKIVNLAQVSQYSALVLVAKASSGIRVPSDLDGRKVGLWESFQVQPRAFFRKYRLRIREVPQSRSVNLFLRGGVDAASAMLYNEYHTILNSGLNPDELTVFRFDEHGLNFPEDGIYALEETYRKDPERACAFARASVDGWRRALAEPEAALDAVIARTQAAGIPADRVHQRWMLEKMRELVTDRETGVMTGMLKPSDYARVSRILVESGQIGAAPAYEDFAVPCLAPRERGAGSGPGER